MVKAKGEDTWGRESREDVGRKVVTLFIHLSDWSCVGVWTDGCYISRSVLKSKSFACSCGGLSGQDLIILCIEAKFQPYFFWKLIMCFSAQF